MKRMNPTWIWLAISAGLFIVEIMTATFTFLFFAIAALLVVVFRLFGLDSWPTEGVVFGVLGIVGLFTFRSKVLKAFGQPSEKLSATDLEQTLRVDEEIGAGAEGQVQYQGSPWRAVNSGSSPLRKGDQAVITKIEGVRLFIQAKS